MKKECPGCHKPKEPEEFGMVGKVRVCGECMPKAIEVLGKAISKMNQALIKTFGRKE